MNRSHWIVLALAAAGCATAKPLPSDQLAASQSSIRSAEAVGAQSDPAASLHLQYAKEQTQQANKLAEKGETERATWMLRKAAADAELAEALARQHATEKQATAAKANVDKPLTP
jgi:hypothetical protein